MPNDPDDYEDFLDAQDRDIEEHQKSAEDMIREKYGDSIDVKLSVADVLIASIEVFRRSYKLDGVVEEVFKEEARKLAMVRVEAVTDEIVHDLVRAEVQDLMTNGFQRTDSWGDPKGEPVTVKQLVLSTLTADDPSATDNYSRRKHSRTVFEQIVHELIHKTVTDVAKEMATSLEEKIRADVEQMTMDDLTKRLRKRFNLEIK